MWDLTLQTDLLQELPAEYSTESALVDLIVGFLVRILYLTNFCLSHFLTCPLLCCCFVLSPFSQDNALQAVWLNSEGERKLIKLVTMHLFIITMKVRGSKVIIL